MSRAEVMGDSRVAALRTVLAGLGFSGAAIEGAAAALDGDGLVPVFRAMAVCKVGRNTIKRLCKRYGIVTVMRTGRAGSLVYLAGVKAAVAGAARIPRGDGTVADGGRMVVRPFGGGKRV